jgi:hypothetical protein
MSRFYRIQGGTLQQTHLHAGAFFWREAEINGTLDEAIPFVLELYFARAQTKVVEIARDRNVLQTV